MKALIRRWLGLQELYEWSKIIEASYATSGHRGKTIQPTPEFIAEQQLPAVEEDLPTVKKGYDAPVR